MGGGGAIYGFCMSMPLHAERNNEVYNNEYQFTDYCHIMSQQKGPEEAYPQGKSLVT